METSSDFDRRAMNMVHSEEEFETSTPFEFEITTEFEPTSSVTSFGKTTGLLPMDEPEEPMTMRTILEKKTS